VVSDHQDQGREFIMKIVIGAAFVAGALVLAPAAINSAAAASPQARQQTGSSGATDFSSQRYDRRGLGYFYRPHYRPYDRPYYYARPYFYRPYPYSVPAPFTFGFNYGPYW